MGTASGEVGVPPGVVRLRVLQRVVLRGEAAALVAAEGVDASAVGAHEPQAAGARRRPRRRAAAGPHRLRRVLGRPRRRQHVALGRPRRRRHVRVLHEGRPQAQVHGHLLLPAGTQEHVSIIFRFNVDTTKLGP